MITSSKLKQYPISTDFTFQLDFIDLDFIKNKLSLLQNNETVLFVFDKTISYHPKYKKFRHSLLNLSHFLFAIINDNKHTALAYRKEDPNTISIFNNNELVAKNTLEDLSFNDFKLVGINDKAKNFLNMFKDIPSVIPQYFFYSIENEDNFLNIKNISKNQNKRILKEDLVNFYFLSFLLDEKFIVLGNNFNFTKSVHFLTCHEALLSDYIFLYFNSNFFKTFVNYSYGDFCTIDQEILINIPIALVDYSQQTYYSWDKQLFLATSIYNPNSWDKDSLPYDYNLQKVDYHFDTIFDFMADE